MERLEIQREAAKVEITPEAMTLVLEAWRKRITEARESGDIKQIKAWLTRFVWKIELGYNLARIYFTYPMIDLLTESGFKTRQGFPFVGGTNQREPCE
jgi:hypothetical protein